MGALREVLSVVVYLILHGSSCGNKIDGTKLNQTGNNFGRKKQGKQIEETDEN